MTSTSILDRIIAPRSSRSPVDASRLLRPLDRTELRVARVMFASISRARSARRPSPASARGPEKRRRRASRATRDARAEDGDDEVETAAEPAGTPVKKTSMLVIGATGTLGRQVVRQPWINSDVRCLVDETEPGGFLGDWGATTVSADLTKPETLPPAFVGVHTVIDVGGAEEDASRRLGGEGGDHPSAAAMGISRYVFYSIDQCDKHREVPLMNMKYAVEGLKVGWMASVSSAAHRGDAVPVLEEQPLWGYG